MTLSEPCTISNPHIASEPLELRKPIPSSEPIETSKPSLPSATCAKVAQMDTNQFSIYQRMDCLACQGELLWSTEQRPAFTSGNRRLHIQPREYTATLCVCTVCRAEFWRKRVGHSAVPAPEHLVSDEALSPHRRLF